MIVLAACTPPPEAPSNGEEAPAGFRAAIVVGVDREGEQTAEPGALAFAEQLERGGAFPMVDRYTGARATLKDLRARLAAFGRRPVRSAGDELLVLVQAHGGWTATPAGNTPTLSLAGGEDVALDALISALTEAQVTRSTLVIDACYPAVGSVVATAGAQPIMVLASQAPTAPAYATVGAGGAYTHCLQDALEAGVSSLLEAHHLAGSCLRAQGIDQTPVVWPPSGYPPSDITVGVGPPRRTALLLVHPDIKLEHIAPDAGVAVLPPGGSTLTEVRGEAHVVHRVDASEGATFSLVPGPSDHALVRRETLDVVPTFRDIAGALGLADLVAGAVSQVRGVTLDARPGLFVTRVELPPVYLENMAPAGLEPRYVDSSRVYDINAGPRSGGNGIPPRVLDLGWDGEPEIAYVDADRRLVAFNKRGMVSTPGFDRFHLIDVPQQADLDEDGLLDTVVSAQEGLYLLRGSGRADRVRVPAPASVQIVEFGAPPHPALLVTDPAIGTVMYAVSSHDIGVYTVREHGWNISSWSSMLWNPGEGWEVRLPDRSGGSMAVRLPTVGVALTRGIEGPRESAPSEVLSLDAADVDLDGLLDVLHAHRTTAPNPQPSHHLFVRRPRSGGWERVPIPDLALALPDERPSFWDVDSDGDPDLLVPNPGDSRLPGRWLRLLLNEGKERMSALSVDLLSPGRPIAGALVGVDGAHAGQARVDGSTGWGAAVFGLGRDAPPRQAWVQWPDGGSTVVEGPDAFTRDGVDWRVQITRGEPDLGRVLVGRYVVDLDSGATFLAEGLAAARDVGWAENLGNELAVWAYDAAGVERVHWIGSNGRELAPPAQAAGCAWHAVQPSANRLILNCSREPASGGYSEEVFLLNARSPLLHAAGLGDVPGLPRGWGIGSDALWLASGNRHLQARAPGDLQRLGASLDAPPGTRSREYVRVASTGAILVLDGEADRVEVWTGDRVATVPVRHPRGAPAWQERPERWYIPVDGGVDVLSLEPGPIVRPLRWDEPVIAALPLGDSRVALVTSDGRNFAVNAVDARGARLLRRVELAEPARSVARIP